MIEIIILVVLCKNIAAKARAKGRSGGGFGFLLVVLWIGGEIFGMVAGGIFSSAKNGAGEPDVLFMYGGALAGAIVGALVAFGIVAALHPINPRGDYDDYDRDDYGDRPQRRARDDRW